jgi:sec-independent protein translocase protein TatC
MDHEITIFAHLDELRKRIIIILISLLVTTVLCLPLAGSVLRILRLPAAGVLGKLVVFKPQDAFLIYMRIGFLSGFVLALPVILYQFWAFVAPAIEKRFKKYLVYFIIFATAAFALGCVFSYYILLPKALTFLLSFGADELEPVISADSYISFVIGLIFCCGFIFQMPIFSFILTKVGLINAGMLRKKFGIAVVAIFVAAAVITPTTDVFNMMLIAIPMLFLYEISIWVSALTGRAGRRALYHPSSLS